MIKIFEYEASSNTCRLASEGLVLTKAFTDLKELCENRIKKNGNSNTKSKTKEKLTDSEQAQVNDLFFEFCKYLFLSLEISSDKNPYREYTEKDRIEAAKANCNLTLSDYNEPILDACINEIKNIYNKNLVVKFINQCYIGIDKLGDYYNAVDFTQTDKTGALIHNANTLKGNLKESANLVETAQNLRKSLDSELTAPTTVKGGHETGFAKGKRIK